MRPSRSFASDNNASVHPEVLEAIRRVNDGPAAAYGDDPHTEAAVGKVREQFGADVEVFFVFNGTAANVLSLQALTRPFHAVLCPESSHIYTDECGAPEKFTGCKLIPLVASDGKLTVETVARAYHGIGDQHHVQPRVVSITQSTEMGTVYTPAEIEALARFAHERQMFLHMDGARISNAAAAQKLTLRQATRDLGVDVLSFGGTKNGLMGAEAVVFFRPELADGFLVPAQAGDAAGVKDAICVGADVRSLERRTLAAQRRTRKPDGAAAGGGDPENSAYQDCVSGAGEWGFRANSA